MDCSYDLDRKTADVTVEVPVSLSLRTGGLAQHLFVVSPTNLQLMPCIPGITLSPGDRGESAKPRLSGWLLEVAFRGSSLEKKVWRITLGIWK
jgi:hypothetical protein